MKILGITGQTKSGKDTIADYLVAHHGYQKIALADPIKRFGRDVFMFSDTQLWGPSEYRNKQDSRYDYYCRIRHNGNPFTANTNLKKMAHECDPGWYAAASAMQDFAEEWLAEVSPNTDPQSLFDWFCVLGNNHPRISPRVMLQYLGTEWGRESVDPDIWVNYFFRVAKRVLEGWEYDHRVGLVGIPAQKKIPNGIVVSDVRFNNELEAIKRMGGKLVKVNRPETDKRASKVGIEDHKSEKEQKSFDIGLFDAVINNSGTLEELLDRSDLIINSLDWSLEDAKEET